MLLLLSTSQDKSGRFKCRTGNVIREITERVKDAIEQGKQSATAYYGPLNPVPCRSRTTIVSP